MNERKNAYALLGFAAAAALLIASDILIANIMAAVTDNFAVQYLAGWLIAYVVWGAGFFLISKHSNKLCQIKQDKINWIIYVIVLLINTIINSILWGGVKPHIEFKGAIGGLGIGMGIAAFILQYIYYALEAALMLIILSCGQQAGEKLFGKKAVPYGGIVLAILWGAMHLYTQGFIDGLWIMLFSLLYGVAYNTIKMQKKLTYPLLFLLFIL